jgi:peptidoglycan-N-acetylglucosamine deacetylase
MGAQVYLCARELSYQLSRDSPRRADVPRYRGGVLRLSTLATVIAVAAAAAVPGSGAAPRSDGPTRLQKLIWRGLPVYCGGTARPWVALTFDDGPGPYTERLATALRRVHAPATFFLVGARVAVWPAGARADARAGVLGNHTWSHAHLRRLRPAAVRRELTWTQAEVVRVTREVPALFRPPYEQATVRVDGVVRRLNLLDVRWDVDTRDAFAGASAESTVATALAGARAGSIVLMHDAHPWTAAAAVAVVRGLRARHLRPVTVPALLDRDPPRAGSRCLARPRRQLGHE